MLSFLLSLFGSNPQQKSEFGHSIKHLFAMSPEITNINNGSYGAPTLEVLNEQFRWERKMESHTDMFFRFLVYKEMDKERSRMAKYLNADA